MTTRVGILGATGAVGGATLSALEANGVPAVALARDTDRARELCGSQTEVRYADLAAPESLAKAFVDLDRLLLSSGHTPDMAELQVNAVRAAEEARIERVVKVSGSPVTMFAGTPASVAQSHLDIERAIQQADLEGVCLRPNVFMENFLGQAAAIANGALPGPEGDPRVSFVAAEDVGRVAAVLLTAEEAEPLVEVTGGEALSFSDVAAILSAELGRPVSYFPAPPDIVRQAMAAQGRPAWLAEHVIEVGKLMSELEAAEITDAVQRIGGRPPLSVTDFVRANAAAFATAA